MNELIMNRNFDSESKIICCVIKRTLSNLNEQRTHTHTHTLLKRNIAHV